MESSDIKHDPDTLSSRVTSSPFVTTSHHNPFPPHRLHDSSEHPLPKFGSPVHPHPHPHYAAPLSSPALPQYPDYTTPRTSFLSDPMLGIQPESSPSPLAHNLQPESTHQAVCDSPDLFHQTLQNLRGLLSPTHYPRQLPPPGIDLHLLYRIVTTHGGSDTISAKGLWAEVAAQLHHASSQPPHHAPLDAPHLRSLYSTHLATYEQVYYLRSLPPARPPSNLPPTSTYPSTPHNPPITHSAAPLSLPPLAPPPLDTSTPTGAKPLWHSHESATGGTLATIGTVSSSMTVVPSDLHFPPPSTAPQVVIFAPPQTAHAPTGSLVGAPLTGTVDFKFDCGYFLTLHIGGQEFRGVLYSAPPYLPRSATPCASPAAATTPFGPPPTHPLGRTSANTSTLPAASDAYLPSATSTPSSQTAKRPRGKDNPLDAKPKQNKTPFNYFSIDARAEAKLKYPNADQKEISRIVGEMWRVASNESKAKYVEQSRVDRLRYEAELAEYLSAKNACSAATGSAAASSQGIGTPTDDDHGEDMLMMAASSQEASMHEQQVQQQQRRAGPQGGGGGGGCSSSDAQSRQQQQHAVAVAAAARQQAAAVAAAQQQQQQQQAGQQPQQQQQPPQQPQQQQQPAQGQYQGGGMASSSPQPFTSLPMDQQSAPPDISMHDPYPPSRASGSQFGQGPPGPYSSMQITLGADLPPQELYSNCSSPNSSELPDAMPQYR